MRACSPDRSALIAGLLSFFCCLTAQADTLSVDGRSVPVRIDGEGPAVVFVHGALSDRRAWDSVIDEVAARSPDHRYIAYTQRHFGPGDGALGIPGDFNRTVHVADLVRIAETVSNDKPVVLVTWSYGGEIGLHAMRERPDLFAAALHFEPILFPLLADIPGGERARQEKVRTMFAPAAALARQGDLDGAALRFIEGAFHLAPGTAIEVDAPWPALWTDNSRTIPAYAAMPVLATRCTDFARIDVPVLIVQGSDTHVDTAMMADRLRDCLANAVTVSVRDADHGLPMREPARFAGILAGFLDLLD